MLKAIEILKAILDNSPDGIILISPDYKVIACNKTFKDRTHSLTGKTIEVGQDSREFIIAEKKTLFLTYFTKAINGENGILQLETKTSNSSIWFEYRMNPVYNTSNKLIGVTLTSKNIDKEKRAEIELEKLAETIKAVLNNTSESIILFDKNLILLNFNKIAFERIKAQTNKELYTGADFREFIYQGTKDEFFNMFNKALNGETNTSEIRVLALNGSQIWFQSTLQPVYKENGELLGVSLFARHITERKLAEIALQENEEKFRKIVETTPTPIIIADENMNMILVNSETEKVFGHTAEELSGKNIRLLIPKHFQTKTENDNSYLNKTNLNSTEINKRSTSVTNSGREILIETGLSTFVLNNKKYIIAIIQDVTQRIRYEEQIANQLKRLQAIAWQQSHEIRRPLTNILGIFNLMKLEPNPTEAEKQKYLDLLYQSAQELDSIIHNIVDHTA